MKVLGSLTLATSLTVLMALTTAHSFEAKQSSCGFNRCLDEAAPTILGQPTWHSVNENVCRVQNGTLKITPFGLVRPFSLGRDAQGRSIVPTGSECAKDMHSHGCFEELVDMSKEPSNSDTSGQKLMRKALKFVDTGSATTPNAAGNLVYNVMAFIEAPTNQGWFKNSLVSTHANPAGDVRATLDAYMNHPQLTANRQGLSNICELPGRVSLGFFSGMDSWLGKDRNNQLANKRIDTLVLKRTPNLVGSTLLLPAVENENDISLTFTKMDKVRGIMIFDGKTFSSGPTGQFNPLKIKVELRSFFRDEDCSNTDHLIARVLIEDKNGNFQEEGFVSSISEIGSVKVFFERNRPTSNFCKELFRRAGRR